MAARPAVRTCPTCVRPRDRHLRLARYHVPVPIVAVSSPDDARLIGYHGVSDPRLAERDGLFVAEGRLVVRRLLSSPALVTRSLLLTAPAHESLADVLDGRPDVTVFLASQDVMNGVAGFNIHRGCLALAERPAPRAWHDVANGARRLVVLEQVGDADNVGSTFRCAAAFGAHGVLLGPSCADPLYRKAIRTSMAATFAVPFAHAQPWPDVLTALDANGWLVIGLTPRADEAPLWEAAAAAHAAPTALVFGHEGEGLSAAALRACTRLARIPMAPGVDSLNVSVSVGVALYEISRRPFAETES
jgi:tRNA G18 (ribose-2'-O)-methylase SpoU